MVTGYLIRHKKFPIRNKYDNPEPDESNEDAHISLKFIPFP